VICSVFVPHMPLLGIGVTSAFSILFEPFMVMLGRFAIYTCEIPTAASVNAWSFSFLLLR
jgi:hypothetical protein